MSREAAGGRAAFDRLYASESPRLLRIVSRLSGDPDLAADLVQDAFVRLHRRESLPDRPAGWLLVVTLNLLRTARIRASRRRRLLAEHVLGEEGRQSPDVDLEAEARRRAVRRVLDDLPPRDAKILLLRAEGYSYREIAAAVGVAESGMGTLLARARAAFVERYGENRNAP